MRRPRRLAHCFRARPMHPLNQVPMPGSARRRGTSSIPRKPVLQHFIEFQEGPVLAAAQGHPLRYSPIQGCAAWSPCFAQDRLKSLLGTQRLDFVLPQPAVVGQPATKRWAPSSPSHDVRDVRRIAPDPCLELRRQDNRPGPISPCRTGKVLVEGSLDLLYGLLLSSTSFVVEHQQTIVVPFRQVGQERNAASCTGSIMLWMNQNVCFDRPDAQRLRPCE